MSVFAGIDVGTGSARAGLFDAAGTLLGMGVEKIEIFRPAEDHAEQSSDDIWRACGVAVRAALKHAGLSGDRVTGIGFDATCSLVALDADDRPVTVSSTGRDAQNVVMWVDHRAMAETEEANATGEEVLRYVGGKISVEMQTPKLMWLKRHLEGSSARVARYFDLPDYLTYRATGSDVRSHCSTVCKWTYLGHENAGAGRWAQQYFDKIGLGDLLHDGARKIGARVSPLGERVGPLTPQAAADLGLRAGAAVGVSIIDAHAGGLGLLGVGAEATLDDAAFNRRLALIGGTSSCHMAVSRDARFVPGVWGPYFSAMIPGMWLNEGGQSATGALIDHTVFSHARSAELKADAERRGSSVYALLNERLEALAEFHPLAAELTREIHVLPDHHGNRSPRADATLRGMVSGLKLSDSLDQLALLYLATVQAVAYGTRHIVETLNQNAYQIDTLIATGGDTKNPLFVREHADATGCSVVLPGASESVLLGSALLGAVAAGAYPDVVSAMRAMSGEAVTVTPDPAARRFHDAKYAVFLRMHDDQLAYRELMGRG